MAAAHGGGNLNRLEDFIDLAKKGEKIRVGVRLRRQVFKGKVYSEETEDISGEKDMYFLIGGYLCESGSEVATISKVYGFGPVSESAVDGRVNEIIANERVKMDYQRLKDANIEFEEKYF